MTARQDLQRAFLSAFRFVRHEPSERPDGKAQEVAFVQLDGEGVMRAALWRSGEWRDHKGRPFAKPLLAWFSVEPAGKGS